jgi:hypothetical protein
MPYRVAADVLRHLLSIGAEASPETWRNHALLVGKQFGDAAAAEKSPTATVITISLKPGKKPRRILHPEPCRQSVGSMFRRDSSRPGSRWTRAR